MKRCNVGIVFVFGLYSAIAAIQGWAQDIRDVKPPVDLPSSFTAMLFILLIIFSAGLGYFFYRRYQRRKISMVSNAPAQTPWERAHARLDALLKSDLIARGQWEEYYLTLSDIIRRYFEERFDIRAPEMTSEEFLMSLRNFGGLPVESKILLEEFLVVCDMVKFAKHAPDAAAGEKNAALARRLIDETKIK